MFSVFQQNKKFYYVPNFRIYFIHDFKREANFQMSQIIITIVNA